MKRTSLIMAAILVAAACESQPDVDDMPAEIPEAQQGTAPGAPIDNVTVPLHDPAGTEVGAARLTQQGEGVEIAVRVSGLAPGMHGFHVHETGQCEPPDFSSAGGHFAPEGRQHGMENAQGPHAGDMPNIRAGDDGTADTTFVHAGISMRANDANSIFREGGTAIVVHEGPDDYRTDPSGDAGSRAACGVIGLR